MLKSPNEKNRPTGHFTAVMDDSLWQSTEDSFTCVVVTVKGVCGGLWVKRIAVKD